MIKFVAKLRAFKKRVISKKKPILMLLNKQLPKGNGTIIDFSLNKEMRSIDIELEKDGGVNLITVINYAVHLTNNETHVSWSKIKTSGAYAAHLNKVFKQRKSIALPAYLYSIVSGVMNNTSLNATT